MKKKLALIILSIIATICCAVGLSACNTKNPDDGDNGDTEHTHTYAESWSHDETYHWHAATCEHTDEVSGKAAHTFENGVCSVCGYNNGTGHTHSLTHTAANAATCEEEGNVEYWYCSGCGKYFSNANATTEITIITTSATGHDWSEVSYEWSTDNLTCTATRTCSNDSSHVETETIDSTYNETTAATCTTEGSGTYTATFENSAFVTQTKPVTISATNHDWGEVSYTWSDDNSTCTATRTCSKDRTHTQTETATASYTGTEATCTTEGSGTYTATFTNTAFETQTKPVTISATNHDWGEVSYTWSDDKATCTATRTCSNDSSHVETETVDSTYNETTAATCTTEGSGTYTATFENSAFVTQTKPVTISATGHEWGEVSYTWSDDNATCTATRTCSKDSTHVETENATASYIETTAATCTTDGLDTYTATFENSAFATQTKEVTLEKTGHKYENGKCKNCGYLQAYDLLTFTLSSDETYYSVTKCISDATEIFIPSAYDNKPVTSIGDYAFSGCTSLTSITIPDSVISIGKYAFYNCTSLTSIEIPDSVTSIGSYAFAYCSKLTSITIPDSVTSINTYAFYGCSALTEINYNATECKDLINGNRVFYAGQSGEGITVNIGANVKRIPAYLFVDVSYLKSVIFAENSVCESIGNSAFYNCTALTEINYNATECADLSSSNRVFYKAGQSGDGITVTIGANVKKIPAYLFYPYEGSSYSPKIVSVVFAENSVCESIGSCAFYNCTLLTSITIPDSVTSIGSYAFYDCTSLTSITIPDSVTSIGEYAFYSTSLTYDEYENACYLGNTTNSYVVLIKAKDTAITSCTIYEKTKVIYDSAFSGCTSLTSITIPDSVTSIGDHAFYKCTSLTSITIPDSVTSIGNSAFSGCTSLTSITIPDSVTSIDNYTFNGCSSLTSITIPDSVTSIGYGAFYNCTSLTSITMTDDVTSIGDYAFYKCTSLTSISIPDSVTSIGSYAFASCSKLASITIPDSVTSIGEQAFQYCSSLTYNEYENACYLGNTTNSYVVLIKAKNTSITSCTIHEKTKFIYASAFSDCSGLTSIEIPDSVTGIGYNAFYKCTSLASLTIGSGVTSIGNGAFRYCTALTEINYNATECADLSSSNYVFSYAGQSGEGITVNIGANVTKIPAYLFNPYSDSSSYSPNIVNVVFAENSVCESIGSYAFYKCTSLASLTIGSGVTSIGNYVFYGCTSLTEINYNATECADLSSGNYVFSYAGQSGDGITVTIGANVKSIPAFLFYPNSNNIYSTPNIVNVVFAENSVCESIGNYAFYECTSLTSVTLGNAVTSIGDYAFKYCYKLIEIYNQSSLTLTAGNEDNGYVAYYAKNVYTATEGESKLTKTDDGYIFYDNTANDNSYYLIGYTGKETSITLPDKYNGNNYRIYQHAFAYCTSLTSIIIPDSVTSIGEYAFAYCTSLTSLTIGSGVTSIGEYAFYNCTALTEINYNATECADLSSSNSVFSYAGQSGKGITVNIGANVTKIPAYLFNPPYGFSSYAPIIVSVVFAENSACESIGEYAFYSTSLTSITIPDGVKSIGSSAFQYCTSLTSVTIGNSVTSIGEYAFAYCTSLTNVTIGSGVTSNYAFAYCTSLTSITLGNGVTSIGDYTFYNCTSLTSIEIPDSVTSIGEYAFSGCTSLASLTIGSGVTSIGYGAFYNTAYYNDEDNWKDDVLYIGKHLIKAKTSILGAYKIKSDTLTIADSAFSGCTSLTSITIPDGVTSVGDEAFNCCISLTSITIPDSVISIGDSAFWYCTSLTSVYYSGSADEWSKISIDSSGNSYLTNATRYYYSESEPTLTEDGTAYDGNYWHYVDGEIVVWTKQTETAE